MQKKIKVLTDDGKSSKERRRKVIRKKGKGKGKGDRGRVILVGEGKRMMRSGY
jgi:hypothetical protein